MTTEVRTQEEQDAAIDDARHEGYEEGYADGAAEQSGWANDTAQAVLAWLEKYGDAFDINHAQAHQAVWCEGSHHPRSPA